MHAERGHAGWRFWLGWLLASTAGIIVGGVVSSPFGENINAGVRLAVNGALFGDAVGLAQWLVLRQQLARAGWWVLASILGLALFGVAGDAAYDISGEAVAVVVALAVLGVYGGITGGAMVWLLRLPVPRSV